MLPLIACALAVLTSNQQPESQPLYRFIAYGDGRGHNAGDQDMTIQKEVVAAMLEAKPAFLVQSGDLVYDGSLQSNWDVFDDVMTPVWRAHIPYYPAEGNHDNTGESLYHKFLEDKIKKTWGVVRPSDEIQRYSVDVAPLRFIAVDTEESFSPESKQYKWIESELADAEKNGLKPVPFFHITIHSVGDHGSDEKKQAEIEPLLMKYHVPLVIMGHDHIYYRTRRHGIVYMTTGGAGAPLYDLHPDRDPRAADDPADQNWPDVSQKAYHFCIFDVFKDHIDITVQGVHWEGPNPLDQFSLPLN